MHDPERSGFIAGRKDQSVKHTAIIQDFDFERLKYSDSQWIIVCIDFDPVTGYSIKSFNFFFFPVLPLVKRRGATMPGWSPGMACGTGD